MLSYTVSQDRSPCSGSPAVQRTDVTGRLDYPEVACSPATTGHFRSPQAAQVALLRDQHVGMWLENPEASGAEEAFCSKFGRSCYRDSSGRQDRSDCPAGHRPAGIGRYRKQGCCTAGDIAEACPSAVHSEVQPVDRLSGWLFLLGGGMGRNKLPAPTCAPPLDSQECVRTALGPAVGGGNCSPWHF